MAIPVFNPSFSNRCVLLIIGYNSIVNYYCLNFTTKEPNALILIW